MSSEVVGIIGAGPFGTALADVIGVRGGRVILHTRDPEIVRDVNEQHRNEKRLPGVTLPWEIRATSNLDEVAREANLIVLAVQSTLVVRTVRALAPALTYRHMLVHSIGALVNGHERVSEVIARETEGPTIGALAGPALARDLVDRRPCALVVASPSETLITVARSALAAVPVLRVYGSSDLLGVELAAAFSGAITIAIGIVDGLNLGAGPRALLVTRALAEASRLGVACGARTATFGGLAGLGNLLVRGSSASSERSDDYQFGVSLAKGITRPETEGMRTIAAALELAQRFQVRTPIFAGIDAIVHDGAPIEQIAQKILDSPVDLE